MTILSPGPLLLLSINALALWRSLDATNPTQSDPGASCPSAYTGQVCRDVFSSGGVYPASSSGNPTFPAACTATQATAVSTPAAAAAAAANTPMPASQPTILVTMLNPAGDQHSIEHQLSEVLSPFRLSAVPASCLDQIKLLLCNYHFQKWPQPAEVCAADCQRISQACELPWKLGLLTVGASLLPNCSTLPRRSSSPCINTTAIRTGVPSKSVANLSCRKLSSWSHPCRNPLSSIYGASANVSTGGIIAFQQVRNSYQMRVSASCYSRVQPILCQLAFSTDNCTANVTSTWSLASAADHSNISHCPLASAGATSYTVSTPTSAADVHSSTAAATLDTELRLALVLGSVGGTLILIISVFAVVKLVRRQRVNYLRSSKRGDIERRQLTGRRHSLTDSVSSGYSSEGPVSNSRRVPQRSYATLSEFAIGGFFARNGEAEGVINPYFALNVELPDDVKRVDRDQIALFRKLSDVSYGKTHQAEVCELLENELTTTVTAKILADSPTARQREDFLADVKLLSTCKHDNIIALMCASLDVEPQLFCVEHVEFGNLRDFLRQAATCISASDGTESGVMDVDLLGGQMAMLSNADLALISSQIAGGMAYLTQKGFVHKDLAARSCQVSAGLHVRITEFGFAREQSSEDYYLTGANKDVLLPVRWTAPEAIMFGQYTVTSSVWSFGITLWEVFSFGARPFAGLQDDAVIKALTQFQTPPLPGKCPDDIEGMMVQCWDKMTTQRPAFSDLQSRLDSFYQLQNEVNELVVPSTIDVNGLSYI